jgi:phosphate transport system substrate-binding protein
MFGKFANTLTGSAALLISICSPACAAELRVNGGASIGAIINKNKAAIEQETGLTLKVTVNGDGNGLRDLTAGTADVAMAAVDMIQINADAMNKANPGAVTVTGLEVAPITSTTTKFIVNLANPVAKSLSAEQLKDIFTGKITSWKEVGGADLPIMVVSLAPGLGARNSVVMKFLGGAEITDKARIMQALAQLPLVVAQAPNAISYGNDTSITDKVAVIPGTESRQAIALVTKGPPSADAKKLINATAKYGTEK